MTTEQTMALLELAVLLGTHKPELNGYRIAKAVMTLGAHARALHKRYENACSYEWANTKAYEKRTEAIEEKVTELADELGIAIEHQRDPRGWPLVIKVADIEMRLG